jgi:hypothetical protein
VEIAVRHVVITVAPGASKTGSTVTLALKSLDFIFWR